MGSFSRLLRGAISAYYIARFGTDSNFACIRVKVKLGRWKNRDPNNLAHLNEAIKDLEIKPKDDGALSLYFVRSRRQGFRVALIHQVTNNTPNEVFNFLFIPTSCLVGLSCHTEIVRQWDLRGQHPMLNKHHFIVYGMGTVQARLELAAAILRHPNYDVVSWSKQKVKRRARAIARKCFVRRFMRFEDKWQTACFGPNG
jgi:hypothetical protein